MSANVDAEHPLVGVSAGRGEVLSQKGDWDFTSNI